MPYLKEHPDSGTCPEVELAPLNSNENSTDIQSNTAQDTGDKIIISTNGKPDATVSTGTKSKRRGIFEEREGE